MFGEDGYIRWTRGRNSCGVENTAYALAPKWPKLPKSEAKPSSAPQPKPIPMIKQLAIAKARANADANTKQASATNTQNTGKAH